MAIADFLLHTFSGYTNGVQVISVSGELDGTYLGWKVANGSTADPGWYSNTTTPFTWKLDCGVGNTFLLDNYSIQSGSLSSIAPYTWTLQGSNDNTNWDTLDTVTALAFGAATLRNFDCDVKTTAYRYFRFNCTKTGGTGTGIRCMVNEFYLFGEAPAGGAIVIPQLLSHRRRRAS
jgi:hypothetical protein